MKYIFVMLFMASPFLHADDSCKENGYKDCYRGIPWGEKLDFQKRKKACGNIVRSGPFEDGEFLPQVYKKAHKACVDKLIPFYTEYNDVLENGTLKQFSMKLRGHLFGEVYGTSCHILEANEQLVGFQGKPMTVSKEEFYYLLSKLKKKYDKPLSSTKCADRELYLWKSGDISIQLTKMPRPYVKGKFDVTLRYLNIPIFKKSSASILEKAKGMKEKKEGKRIKKMGLDEI